MTDPESRLRDLLDRAAPEQTGLDAVARAAAVVRRGRAGRRRDRLVVGGVAAAVLALTVGVPLALGRDDAPEVAAPPSAEAAAAPCPQEPVDVTDVPDVPATSEWAIVSARMCPAVFSSPGGGVVTTVTEDPTTPLTGRFAADFAADVGDIEEFVMGDGCAAMTVFPDPWSVVVTTRSGTSIVLGSPTRECDASEIANAARGSQEVVAAFTGNLGRQQSGERRPGADGPSCPTGDRLGDGADTWNASFVIPDAVAGVVCYRADPLGVREYAEDEGRLTAQQLAQIVHGGFMDTGNRAGGCTDTGPQRLLVLVDKRGDRVGYLDEDCTGAFRGPRGAWELSPEGEQAITAALGGRR